MDLRELYGQIDVTVHIVPVIFFLENHSTVELK